MARFLAAYAGAALCLLGLDLVWLTQMTSLLYRPFLGPLMADRVSPAPAVLFYALYLVGVVQLAVAVSGHWREAVLRGALLGLVAYGTYDLTNHATLKGWPAVLTLADMAWGTVLTACAAGIGYAAASRLGRSPYALT
ncbi:DUF2177 family protein [Labrys monachus]|uniref:Membrane protein n=1 Tax=Labrys monachus TaxID=217067 RepID=A0ABU0FMH4_9HYPH|nr:DUF2177 family protein [Labrys monachus]MDQ0395810.1 putative membrane protein [Labrys monachus]